VSLPIGPWVILPEVSLAAAEVTRLMHGGCLSMGIPNAGSRLRRIASGFYDEGAGQFLGIGASDGQGTVRPVDCSVWTAGSHSQGRGRV